MASKRWHVLPSWGSVVAGEDAILSVPRGMTIEVIEIEYSGVTLAQMKNIECLINGKPFQTFLDAAELDAYNKYYGRGAAANGRIYLWFIRPELEGLVYTTDGKGKPHIVHERDLTAIGTLDIATFEVKMSIDAAASAPAIKSRAMRSANQPLGLITKIRAYPQSFATTGEQDIDNIPKTGNSIVAIHQIKSAEDITNGIIEADSTKLFDMSENSMIEFSSKFKRTRQAGWFHYDFVAPSGSLKEALSTDSKSLSDLRIRPTLTTSGLVRTLVEFVDGFNGL